MKKKILSLVLALTLVLALVPMAMAAETGSTPVFVEGITVEIPGISGMTLILPRVYENCFYREADGAIIFAFGYQPQDDETGEYDFDMIFDRDITLSPLPPYYNNSPEEAGGVGLASISVKAGVPVDYGWLNHYFTIDGVNVYFYQASGEPEAVFIGGTFMGQDYAGMTKEWSDQGFEMRPISGIATDFAPADPGDPLDKASDWAREGITGAVAKGFVPAEIQNDYIKIITRQEFCRMAVRWVEYAAGKGIDALLAEKELTRDPNAFTDTSDPDMLAAFALGITNGVGDNRFDPDGRFSREQAATMIMNTCKAIGMDVSNPPPSGFADIGNASSWAVSGINFVRANGIMQGTGDNNFSPGDTFTRQESIVTFYNVDPNIAANQPEKLPVSSPLVAGKRIPILMYHAIADVPTTSLTDLFVRPAELRAQLQYLADNGFQTITFEDLDNIGAFSKPIMLTFDDGYECNYNVLFPMLKEFNMKATIFVVTNALWSPGRLTEPQVREMSDSGLVSIQSHTDTHPSLTSLDAAALDNELSLSKAKIEELTGKPVMALCYPSGANNAYVRSAAAKYYDYAVLNVGGQFICGSNLMAMNRVRIGRGLGVGTFASLVN